MKKRRKCWISNPPL